MTADRLNDHVKRATGVTAGHLIRQRVLTEAKRQLVFTSQPIHEIAYDLAFSDPVALRALFPQADRHDAAGIPRRPGRLDPLLLQRILADEGERDDRAESSAAPPPASAARSRRGNRRRPQRAARHGRQISRREWRRRVSRRPCAWC